MHKGLTNCRKLGRRIGICTCTTCHRATAPDKSLWLRNNSPLIFSLLIFFFFFWCVYKAINIVTHTCPNTNIDQVFSTGKRQVRHSLCSMIYWLSTCWAHHSTRIPRFSFVYWEKEGKKKEIKEAKILSVLIEQCSSFGTALGD